MKLFIFVFSMAVAFTSTSHASADMSDYYNETREYKVKSGKCYTEALTETKVKDCNPLFKKIVVKTVRPSWNDRPKICVRTAIFSKCYVDESPRNSSWFGVDKTIYNSVEIESRSVYWEHSEATSEGHNSVQSIYVGPASDTGDLIYKESDFSYKGGNSNFEKGRIYQLEAL